MRFFKWNKGRQDQAEYYKFPIYSFKIWKFGFDCYILKFPPKTTIPEHTDPVQNGDHWRINITISGWQIFRRSGKITHNKICLFRPDIEPHYMYTPRGCRMISFGFVKFKR